MPPSRRQLLGSLVCLGGAAGCLGRITGDAGARRIVDHSVDADAEHSLTPTITIEQEVSTSVSPAVIRIEWRNDTDETRKLAADALTFGATSIDGEVLLYDDALDALDANPTYDRCWYASDGVERSTTGPVEIPSGESVVAEPGLYGIGACIAAGTYRFETTVESGGDTADWGLDITFDVPQ